MEEFTLSQAADSEGGASGGKDLDSEDRNKSIGRVDKVSLSDNNTIVYYKH